MADPRLPEMFRSQFIEQYYLESDAVRPPLRIGVLADNTRLIAPFALVLDQIRRSSFARVELVILNGLETHAPAPQPASLPVKLLRLLADPTRRGKLGYSLYARWDEKRFPDRQDVLAEVDCSGLLAGAEQITVRPLVKGFVHRFPEEVVQTVKDRNLDVLLRFGFNIIKGGMLSAAHYGMWSYHHGDNDAYRGGPAYFWELAEGNPCSGVILQVLNEELDNGIILDKAVGRTETSYSQCSNRVRPYLLGSHMMIRALHDLHKHGWEHLRQRASRSSEYRGRRKIYRTPSNADMARFAGSRLSGLAERRLRSSRGEPHWRLAIRETDPAGRLPDSTRGFRWIESPAGHFYADPFLLTRGDRTWLFFEDYLYPERRGTIGCAELRPDGSLGEARRVLDLPCHLSYPFVLEQNDEVFMIPESRAAGTVDLYRATDFPYSWKREKTLLATGGTDTTICRRDGILYLFTTIVDPPGSDNRMFLFHSDDLFGEWKFHPANPVCSDVRFARAAGAFVTVGDRLIRPAQDGSVRYGYATHFQEVTKLNTCEYGEKRAGSLYPPEAEGIQAVHSFARGGGFDVIDGTELRRL